MSSRAFSLALVASTLFAGLLSFGTGCGGSDSGNGNGNGGSSSSTGSSCSSESTSHEAFLCVNDACKCASSKEDKYPYTREQAKSACSSGTSTGNCPSTSGDTTSGGTTSGGTTSPPGGGSSGDDPEE